MTPSTQSVLEEGTKKLELIIYLIIVAAFIGVAFRIPWYVINGIIQLLVCVFVGVIFSSIAGAIVEAATADWLKTIAFNIEIKGFKLSITAFAMVSFFVKVCLFGL